MKRFTQILLVLIATISLSGIARGQSTEGMNAPGDDTVFQEFGGKTGIGKVIDDFLGIWQGDPRISGALKDADVERLGSLLKEQITQLTGGPAVYSGKDMKAAHQSMGLHNADFNALAEDLQHAMDKNSVPVRAQNKLLAKLAPMEHAIVTK
ncbi:MAG TPA: group 1 truncated hemoglobin [Burkholderiaceae bacterium]